MFQNADGNFTGQFNTRAGLLSDGTIQWEIPLIFRSSCKIDVTYFPYDTQVMVLDHFLTRDKKLTLSSIIKKRKLNQY